MHLKIGALSLEMSINKLSYLNMEQRNNLSSHLCSYRYVTRHDILCPNAVERDVGKTRCKSDVIYATALCCAICTSLSLIC